MLAPTTIAPLASRRHVHTIALTRRPHAIPSSNDVTISRRKLSKNQRRVSVFTRNAWMVSVIDCMLTLSFRPSTIVRKNATTRLPASVASNAPASTAQAVPAATVASNHGKR